MNRHVIQLQGTRCTGWLVANIVYVGLQKASSAQIYADTCQAPFLKEGQNAAWKRLIHMLQVDANIAKDLVFGDPKAPRFVFWDKKLRPTPSGPDVLTFDLLSIWGKIRAGLGAAGIKKPLPGTFWYTKSGLAIVLLLRAQVMRL